MTNLDKALYWDGDDEKQYLASLSGKIAMETFRSMGARYAFFYSWTGYDRNFSVEIPDEKDHKELLEKTFRERGFKILSSQELIMA